MGNFSVNHYSRISLDREGIRISYIIDLAEIPPTRSYSRVTSPLMWRILL